MKNTASQPTTATSKVSSTSTSTNVDYFELRNAELEAKKKAEMNYLWKDLEEKQTKKY